MDKIPNSFSYFESIFGNDPRATSTASTDPTAQIQSTQQELNKPRERSRSLSGLSGMLLGTSAMPHSVNTDEQSSSTAYHGAPKKQSSVIREEDEEELTNSIGKNVTPMIEEKPSMDESDQNQYANTIPPASEQMQPGHHNQMRVPG